MDKLTQRSIELAHALVGRAATEQGGVLSGDNPTDYDARNPIRLWIIQIVIIISMTQFLAFFLGRIRQPRVIAEVIGGILLGPSVMGRIPHFHERIFPANGMAMLTLTSNIGLVLFLFLVGLEIDTKLLKRNMKVSATVSLCGLILPLGMGAALGVAVYHEFISPSVNFGNFLLFVAVAMGITAFPVLCRILTELKLLDTSVGVVVISAAIGDDVVGWVLLALTVTLVNASDGLTALWVLLCSLGFVGLMLFPIRWGYAWLARRTGSLAQGSPTPLLMTITLFLVFGSAFFTDVIGVHAIFGGFLAGLIMPKENGFGISLVEKLEDLVSILLMPIYFTLSGLRTNLGLLDTGKIWGYTILICVVAFVSKTFACGGAAKAFGFSWREAATIGSFMSCKGLVELIVLNIGLQAEILDPMTFSMFVVHALVLTFMTTPLVLFFYPERIRKHEGSALKGDTVIRDDGESAVTCYPASEHSFKTRFTVVLERFEQLPMVITLLQLLQGSGVSERTHETSLHVHSKALEAGIELIKPESKLPIAVNALRLVELTDRPSAVMKSHEADALLWNDPILAVIKTFGRFNRLIVSAALSVVSFDQFPSAVSNHVSETESQMVIIPWCNTAHVTSDSGEEASASSSTNSLARNISFQQTSSSIYSEFVRKVFINSPSDVAVFVDRGVHPGTQNTAAVEQHILLPFFGGPDDRLALLLLIQLCANPIVRGTVVRFKKSDHTILQESTATPTSIAVDTVPGPLNTQARLQSDTADHILWDSYVSSSAYHPPHIASALSRISFVDRDTTTPLRSVIDFVSASTGQPISNAMVILGRSKRMATESHRMELAQLIAAKGHSIGSAVPTTLGDVGAALVAYGVSADLLVVQAAL